MPGLLIVAVGFCYLRLWLNMRDGTVALASGMASRTGEIANELPDPISDVKQAQENQNMSPTVALQSPVFLFYLALATSLLVSAGVVLAVLKWGLRKNVGHAWTAYCGWLFMVPLLLLVFFLAARPASSS